MRGESAIAGPEGSERLLSALLDQAQAALVALDLDGRVTHWNKHAEILYGWSHSEALGKSISSLLILPRDARGFESAFATAAAGEVVEHDTLYLRKTAPPIDVHVTYSPLMTEGSEPIGVVAVSFDISDRIATEKRLGVNSTIAEILSDADHIYEASSLILSTVCKQLDWSIGAVWQVDRLTGQMRCVEEWHGQRSELAPFADSTRWRTLAKGEGLSGTAWARRSTLWIEDIRRDPTFIRRTAAEEAGLRSAVCAPITIRGEVLGAIEFFTPDLRKPDEAMIELIVSIANQIGQYMERRQAEDDRLMSDARKSAILESAIDCIITMDHLGKVLEFNPSAEAVFGYKREDVIGKEMAELIIPPQLRDAHRKGLLHYLETGSGPVLGQRLELSGMRSDGSEFPIELAISRVDVPGPPVFSGYLRDITDRKESETERLRLLEAEQRARAQAEAASNRLGQLQRITDAALSNLAVDELLEELLDRIRDVLHSDTAAILLRREDSDDLSVRAAKGLGVEVSSIPPVAVGQQAAGIVAASGEPMIIEDLQDAVVEAKILRSSGMRSFMAVPLAQREENIGVLVTASKQPAQFTSDDLELLRLAADRIVVPIQNASLYEREHRIATTLQRSLLPTDLPEVPGLKIEERYIPGGRGLEVGGDWYDVILLPEGRIGLVIGDVVGKGIKAAALMGQLRNALRAYAMEGSPPDVVLDRMNRLSDVMEHPTMIATMIYMIYDPSTNTATFCNAGHPPPMLQHEGGEPRFLDHERNIPLGVLGDFDFTSEEIELPPGCRAVLYTDGLVEEPGRSVDDGLERLRVTASKAPSDLRTFCDFTIGEVFRERERGDDIAMLVFSPSAIS